MIDRGRVSPAVEVAQQTQENQQTDEETYTQFVLILTPDLIYTKILV